MAGDAVISPRDGYPLYFAIGDVVMWATRTDGARALNLASAIEGALASGMLVLVATEVAGSLLAGIAAALFFAGSYTFWSQSIIAEVYALHALMTTVSLLLLLRWQEQPTTSRLVAFFLGYAVGFGNHLSMILLAPAFALFIGVARPGGWREILTPRIVGLALGSAAICSLQYLWNLRALWLIPDSPPPTVTTALGQFWLDVTKADWRQTTMLSVPAEMAGERGEMYLFDLLQQFGWAGPTLAAIGVVYVSRQAPRRSALLLAAYGANLLFALTYNVGDSHVFLLPSHLFVAVFLACGIAWIGSSRYTRIAGPLLLMLVATMKMWRDFPALDRSDDIRATRVLERLTHELDDRHAILLADVNWQLENGLRYFARFIRPEVAWALMADVSAYAPRLIRDNLEIGRRVVLTAGARADLEASYGDAVQSTVDRASDPQSLASVVESVPQGTRYVLAVLRPSHEFFLGPGSVDGALRKLTGNSIQSIGSDDYQAVAGVVGEPPAFAKSARRPFRAALSLAGTPVEIRMESWLAFDTIRRMGFGHVIVRRQHALIVERGVSFVAFDDEGRPTRSAYAASVFAPQPRYLVESASAQ